MSKNKEGLAAELARLARIELSDSALESTQAQLGSILTYIETLQDLDLREVPERLESEQNCAPLREDQLGSPFDPQRLLAGAPRRRDDLVEVPKVKGEQA